MVAAEVVWLGVFRTALALFVLCQPAAVVVAVDADAVDDWPIADDLVMQRPARDRIRWQCGQILWRYFAERLRPLAVIAMIQFQRQANEHAVAIAVASHHSIQKSVIRWRQQH